MTDREFEDLVTQTFLDIAHHIAHTEPCISAPTELNGPLKTFGADVCGDYRLCLALCTTPSALAELATGMRRGAETDEETAAIYVTEFFNILCGKLVSSLNMAAHATARFGIPYVMPGPPKHAKQGHKYYYKLRTGPLLIQAIRR